MIKFLYLILVTSHWPEDRVLSHLNLFVVSEIVSSWVESPKHTQQPVYVGCLGEDGGCKDEWVRSEQKG